MASKAQAAEARKAAAAEPDTDNDKWIEALLKERQGYVTRGQHDRAKLVDKQLIARGYKAPSKSGTKAGAKAESAAEAPDAIDTVDESAPEAEATEA